MIGVPLKMLTLGGFRQMSVPASAEMLHDEMVLLGSMFTSSSFLVSVIKRNNNQKGLPARKRKKRRGRGLFIPHGAERSRSFYPAGAFPPRLRTTKPGSGVVG